MRIKFGTIKINSCNISTKEAIYMTIDDIINLSSDLTGFSPYGNIPYG
ncbi:hypothetical protein CMALT394_620013 [Carnobacterium maltaromaticum]|nr:hypothetical protein CMALT394_620013 [Carnobacterium maltaromaticum]